MKTPSRSPGFHGSPPLTKEEGERQLVRWLSRLDALQERLYAEGERSVLLVLQGMDASGKDGTIKTIAGAMNPLGIRSVAFKAPTPEELAHDFLWRIHRQTPRRGEIVFFNRSHYEDVLVARVDRLVPEAVWHRRYERIREFERNLVESGTAVVKFFLNISSDEQRERLQARVDDPSKRWKFSADDLRKRRQWKAYQHAYRNALKRCDSKWAPWIVVPADHKWYRNLVVARDLVAVLERIDPQYPRPNFDPKKIRVR